MDGSISYSGSSQVEAMDHSIQAPSQSAQQESRLLRLPAELRNTIYEFALIEKHPITIKATDAESHIKFSQEAQQPSLTRTCREIRNESLPVFYNGNTFRVHVPSSNLYHPPQPRSLWARPLQPAEIVQARRFNLMWLKNTFGSLRCWLKRIGDENAKLIGRLECTCDRYDIVTGTILQWVFRDAGSDSTLFDMRPLLGWTLKDAEAPLADFVTFGLDGNGDFYLEKTAFEMKRL